METGLNLTPQIRKTIAAEIRGARRNDRLEWYTANRGIGEYLDRFYGLENYFNYVRTLNSQKILDIGAGTGKGVYELAESSFGKGLTFEATILSRANVNKIVAQNIKMHQVAAESMDKFQDYEFGGVLALCSVAYSEQPQIVVKNIDRILVSGGVFKGVFYSKDGAYPYGDIKLKGITPFKDVFQAFGYDTAQVEGALLALKPGANISAEELLFNDYDTFHEQYEKIQAAN